MKEFLTIKMIIKIVLILWIYQEMILSAMIVIQQDLEVYEMDQKQHEILH